MDIVIEFFRDTLDGPFYIVWVVVLVILIFACIGYLAEKGINKKHEKEKYATVNEENAENNTVVTEPVNEPVMEASPQMTEVVNNVAAPVVEDTTSMAQSTVVSANTASVNDVNEVPRTVTEVTAAPVNNTVVMPNVVSQNVEPTTVVGTNPTPQGVNNVVIPTINQDENNKTV